MRRDDVEARFRALTEGMEGAPVRWDRIESVLRRRRLLALLGLFLVTLALAILVTIALLAGKNAIDPTFHPAFLTGARTTVTLRAPIGELGHTSLAEYLGSPAQRLLSREMRREGLVFRADARVVGQTGRFVRVDWSLRRADSDRTPVRLPQRGVSQILPPSGDYPSRVDVWIANPSTSGRYVLVVELRDTNGEVIASVRGAPFFFPAPDYFVRYEAPTYVALRPRGWPITKRRYKPLRRVTTFRGPDGISVRIDTTLRSSGGDPRLSATRQEPNIRAAYPGYQRLIFMRATLGQHRAFEWSWRTRDTRTTIIYFVDGRRGYGVVANGPLSQSGKIRTLAREVARSVAGPHE